MLNNPFRQNLLTSLTALLIMSSAFAQDTQETYKLTGRDLKKDGLELSGVAILKDSKGFIGPDEGKSVYHITIDHATREINVGDNIKLTDSKGEIDIEGVAAGGEDVCYIIGSHGISRKGQEFGPNAYSIWKLEFDKGEWEYRRSSLSDYIATNQTLAPFYRKRLQENGVNIEGIAYDPINRHLYAGFRAPSIDGQAFVLEVESRVVFGTTSEFKDAQLHAIKLGEGYGIRDIIKIDRGFLILAGNSAPSDGTSFDPNREYRLCFWRGIGSTVKQLAVIPKPNEDAKPEALLLLNEDSEAVEVLVISDSAENGEPTVLRASF